MKFFKKFGVSVGELPRSYDNTFEASVDYFASSDIVANKHICNKERVILNRYASGELLCSKEELDQKLNKEVINERATQKYAVEDNELTVADAEWFPRLRTIKYNLKDDDAISRTSSEVELYDGFSGPWSWETTSLQEMGFPPTPEAEPKNKNNTNIKKNKKKKKLTVNGEEEDDISDLRTLETLDELKARLKANYIEAKKQREKYLNLAREQSSEEKRAKSVKGNRDNSKQKEIVNKNKKNTTEVTVQNVGKVNGDVSGPKAPAKFTLENNGSSIADSFQNELESVIFKTSSNLSPDVPKTPDLNISKSSSISSEQILTDSPSKPLLKSSGSSSASFSIDNTTSPNKNGSLEYFVPGTAGSGHMGTSKLNEVVQNTSNNISSVISSHENIASSHSRKNSKRKSKKKEENKTETVKCVIESDSRDESFVIEESEKKEENEDVEVILPVASFATIDSSPAEESANDSVIKNDNIEIDIGISGGGLGNVMDMLSNW